MDSRFESARDFIYRDARLLERRLFATRFTDGPTSGIIDALRGYQNPDGGFGHGLEPDKRCPFSLPIDVELALQTLVIAGVVDESMVISACEFLARVAKEFDKGGAVPLAFAVIESFPRASHWSDWTYQPGLNPTAGIAGLLYALGVDHQFRDDAARYSWSQMRDRRLPDDAHGLTECLVFLEYAPETDQTELFATEILEKLAVSSTFKMNPEAVGYGLTPLHVAPTPDSRWRSLFSKVTLDSHLDRLSREQQDDGGWNISWQPPSTASVLEWRGIETLRALRTLVAYGRIEPLH